MRLIEHLANSIVAMRNCEKNGNTEWHDKHYERILWLVKNALPSGSGIDSGTKIDFDASNGDAPEKIVLQCSFHHMDEHGGYDGWTDHTVVARPSFVLGIDLTITGKDRNDIKDYLSEVYYDALMQQWTETESGFSRTPPAKSDAA
jgi:hypothetical protein